VVDVTKSGFGGVLVLDNEWANREDTVKSYELFGRYVMPRLQGSLDTVAGSNLWCRSKRKTIFGPNVAAIRKAFADAGKPVPQDFAARTTGAADVDPGGAGCV